MWRCSQYAVLLMFIVWGCATAPSGPVQTYGAFYQAVSEEDWDLAVTFLSPRARKTFTKVGRELQSIVGAEGDPLDFFLQGIRAQLHTPLLKVEQIEQSGDSAKLKVVAGKCGQDVSTEDCFRSEVPVVFISGRWYVDPKLPTLGVEDGVTKGG